ncbi:MAG TPA: hypothetical protein VJR94_12345 [Candidatus Nitrosocosmicus sp.]|nr:hypothetical protein [Candidatus Nitrosocosmicus sp.]
MTSPTQYQSESCTKLSNSIYNILSAMGRDADFLYSTVDRYIEDAQKDRRDNLVEIWKEIKQDKEKHLTRLRDYLEKEAKEEKLST